MRSITRRLAISLGLAAAMMYLGLLGVAISLPIAREREQAACRVAADVLERATLIEKGRVLAVRDTGAVTELKANSPDLWYVISYETLVNEYGRDRRPPLPFALPYGGPTGFSVLYALDQRSVFCLAVMRRGDLELSMAIGGAQVPFAHIAASFLSRNFLPIALMAVAFAATVAIGALLAARFVGRSMERVTRLALSIDPAAPQGSSIPLEEVPIELKPLAAALNRAFGEIDAYIKMQRRFLGNAAHQLRTPLTLLRAKVEDVSDASVKAELVRDVRRLTSLVAAMLDLARLQNHAIEKRPIDLAAVTRDVLADFSPSALDAGIELSLEQADGGTVVQAVEAAIRSALTNLIGNALIHARGARHITARLACGSVAISDDGAGLAASAEAGLAPPSRERLPEKEGAGLGLSIVQEIMAAHGGELIVTSSADKGTTMSLRFAEATAETARPA